MQRGEGSRGDAGDPVVVQRQQAHRAQTCECVVVNAADLVAPQHAGKTKSIYLGNNNIFFTILRDLESKLFSIKLFI